MTESSVKLSEDHIKVLRYIVSKSTNGLFSEAIDKIGKDLGLSEDTIKSILSDLSSAGYIELSKKESLVFDIIESQIHSLIIAEKRAILGEISKSEFNKIKESILRKIREQNAIIAEIVNVDVFSAEKSWKTFIQTINRLKILSDELRKALPEEEKKVVKDLFEKNMRTLESSTRTIQLFLKRMYEYLERLYMDLKEAQIEAKTLKVPPNLKGFKERVTSINCCFSNISPEVIMQRGIKKAIIQREYIDTLLKDLRDLLPEVVTSEITTATDLEKTLKELLEVVNARILVEGERPELVELRKRIQGAMDKITAREEVVSKEFLFSEDGYKELYSRLLDKKAMLLDLDIPERRKKRRRKRREIKEAMETLDHFINTLKMLSAVNRILKELEK